MKNVGLDFPTHPRALELGWPAFACHRHRLADFPRALAGHCRGGHGDRRPSGRSGEREEGLKLSTILSLASSLIGLLRDFFSWKRSADDRQAGRDAARAEALEAEKR